MKEEKISLDISSQIRELSFNLNELALVLLNNDKQQTLVININKLFFKVFIEIEKIRYLLNHYSFYRLLNIKIEL
jgi:hypothetical protein